RGRHERLICAALEQRPPVVRAHDQGTDAGPAQPRMIERGRQARRHVIAARAGRSGGQQGDARGEHTRRVPEPGPGADQWHPFSAPETARTNSSTVTAPSPLGSLCTQTPSVPLPRLALTLVTSSFTVTVPSKLQSPGQVIG